MIDGVDVFLNVGGVDVPVGRARFTKPRRTGFLTDFTYDREWLSYTGAFDIDPRLPRHTPSTPVEGLPFSFDDSSPDAWGKRLIRAAARRGGEDSPGEVEFLLGVSDTTRHGALRFKTDGHFQSPGVTVPNMVALPALEAAAAAVSGGSSDDGSALKLLLAGSGSLGGARPKASVTDGGRLLIAKFSDASDEWDVIAWEKATLDLAARAGIDVPRTSLLQIDNRKALILDRFDRAADGSRIPYMSARTLLGAADPASGDYEEIGEALTELDVADITATRHALWRRAAFSVAVHNTDDHLKNHGLLRTSKGWELSPAFDMNPERTGGIERATGISGAYLPGQEPAGLTRLATAFGVRNAADILDEILAATSGWADVAHTHGITNAEIELFDRVFSEPRKGLLALRDQLGPNQKSGGQSPQPRLPRGAGGGRFARPRRPDGPALH